MAKQQSDNIEDRFREAAENISFPPNEEAWDRMEALLDKDKRRRPVFAWWFLLLFGLLVGAGVFSYRHLDDSIDENNPSRSSLPKKAIGTGADPAASEPPTDQKSLRDSTDADLVINNNTDFSAESGLSDPARVERAENNSSNDSSGNIVEEANKPGDIRTKSRSKDDRPDLLKRQYASREFQRKSDVIAHNNRSAKSQSPAILSGRNRTNRTGIANGAAMIAKADRKLDKSASIRQQTTDSQGTDLTNSSDQLKKEDSIALVKANDRTASVNDQANGNDSAKLHAPDSIRQKNAPIKFSAAAKKWKLNKGFNFSLGARIDATDLHTISLHQFNQLAAGTIGYRFSNRLSLQTGIIVQKAVYFAGPQDYYVKPGSYLSYYRISKIDAVCQIYEIPLNVRYDLLIGKGLRVYAVGGINSFYMKKENYRYHATGSSGYRMFDSTYRENKNLFSSAYFAAGVEKKITPVFSVLAEPYAKLPISGVGAGKVKLYSGGIQLMLRYQPQSNKNSSQKK